MCWVCVNHFGASYITVAFMKGFEFIHYVEFHQELSFNSCMPALLQAVKFT